MITHRKAFGLSVVLVLAGLALAAPVQAQTDTRWTPYFGCWQPAGGSSDGGLLCFRPVEDDTGVEMVTVADGEIVMTEIFKADGSAQSIEREGCTGSENAEFSSDGRRIYTRSLYTCAGDVSRGATGIMSIVSPSQWVDVRSVGVEGEQMAWVQFYEAADPAMAQEIGLADGSEGLGMAIRSSRMAASAPLDFEDVIDAAEHVDAKAVEAWIAERGDRFALTAPDLIALDAAGLPTQIIDIMVAVSNPAYFQVDGGAEAVEPVPSAAGMRTAYNRFPMGRYYDPFFFDPFYYGYSSRYSYGISPWGYSGYGYGGYGGYGGGWYNGYQPRPIIVVPVDNSPRGRVVNGRGYSRGGSSGGTSSRPAARSGSGGSGSSGSSARPAASRGSSAGSTAGSTSSGSSGSRTAVRRRGGG